jgi:outer membrane protein assembly factor BamB
MLFFASLDSHIYGLDIRKGNQLWEFPTMDIIDSSPSIGCNMLFVGGRDSLLYAFGRPEAISYIR